MASALIGAEYLPRLLMKIHVNCVPEEGLTEHATYDPTTLDMDRADIHPREAFSVEAKISKADRELMVRVDIRCPLQLTCARCLEEFTTVLTPAGIFSYSVSPTDVIDITNDVRQEIMLAYPFIPVCRPDCKGLCPECGQILNMGPCSHRAT